MTASSPALSLQSLQGAAIGSRIEALAELRTRVFRDWPYLYQGTAEYEAQYLQMYLDSPRSLAVLVNDGDRVVGATTMLPLLDAPAEVQTPFIEAGMDLARIAYFGESVLLREYRGRGLGVAFFAERERHARALGLSICAFAAVERAKNDPRQPVGYVGNEAFWARRAYRPQPQMQAWLDWLDVGDTQSSAKPLTVWLRELESQTA